MYVYVCVSGYYFYGISILRRKKKSMYFEMISQLRKEIYFVLSGMYDVDEERSSSVSDSVERKSSAEVFRTKIDDRYSIKLQFDKVGLFIFIHNYYDLRLKMHHRKKTIYLFSV